MFKKLTALILVLVLVIGLVPAASAAPETAVDTGDVTIQGTNGFGNLLSQEITESQTESAEEASEYPGGYTVTDLEIEGNIATVTYDTMEEATLVVALYTEDGMRMVTSATAAVTPDTTTATVTFEGEMPEYFLASAYLLDSYDLSPLCAAYDTPMYTREMQELLASTVDDYDPEKVLNLDDNETTNFAVYADSTIIIEAAEGVNTVDSIDDENATYVIKNADEQITSLVEGNVFVYPYAEGEILIVKVASIEVSSTTATITGTELELEEVFSYMKIENTGSTEDMVVDEDSGDDGVTYVGTQEIETVNPNAWGDDAELQFSMGFNVEKKIDKYSSFSGSLGVQFDVEFEYYISLKRQFVRFEYGSEVAIKIGYQFQANAPIPKATSKLKLKSFGYSPVAGVYLGFEPEVIVEFTASVEVACTLRTSGGFSYEAGKGYDNLSKKPTVDVDIKFEGVIFFGIDFGPHISILKGSVAKIKLSSQAGLELTGKTTGSLFEDITIVGDDPKEKHDCQLCISVELAVKADFSLKIELLKCDWLTFEAKLAAKRYKIGACYYSETHSDFGWGECPHKLYRLTVVVVDGESNYVPNAQVTAGVEQGLSDQNGAAIFYLPDGTYAVKATDGSLTRSQNVSLDSAQKVTIKLSEDVPGSADHIFDKVADILKSEMADFENILDTSLVIYNGHTYTLFDGKASSWEAAKDYCESLGGHLATITSAEENAFLYNIMLNFGYSNAYWGLTDHANEGVWEWCTGEPVTYVNWATDEPNDDSASGPDGEDYGMYWDGRPDGFWNDGNFGNDGSAFLCEWDYLLPEAMPMIFNDHTYLLIHTDVASWEAAEAYCEAMGGHLATITSAEENNFIYSYIVECGHRNAFFGLTDKNSEGTWEWCTGEAVTYSNWPEDQPSDNVGKENYGMYWDYYSNGEWNDGAFTTAHPFICEWDSITNDEIEWASVSINPGSTLSPTAVYPGDYGTEITDTYTLKTASFKDLVPNEQYVMLAMASVEVADPLAADNLLFIDQATALEDGTLTFQYVQRTPRDISYVVACGASHKNLKDAEISFPEMVADGELQVVDPVVVYDGETLVEGRDYVVVGKVDFTEAGEYTCSIRGIHNYTGLVECTYTVTTDLTEVASGWSGATEWTLTSDGTLTVYGEGNMKNYGYNGGQPWLDKGVDVTNVVIEEGVTAVGTGAFRNLTTLEAVTLPESGLSKIGEAAFYGCTSLREIAIPEGVYTVWAYTFKNCSALTEVKLPKTLIKIDQGAFESAVALPYIYIPTNVEIIGSWSFKGCTALEEVEMTWANATEIREGAFKNCSALTTVQFPTGIQKFGDSAFYGIGAESFTVPATVTTVGPWCFARAHVKEITFEGDAPAIGEGAFNKITLTAFYPNGNSTWTAELMQNYGGTVTWKAQ